MVAGALVAAAAAQWALQRHLGDVNRARSVLAVRSVPDSFAFLMAAGGVREAAGDGLWLTVLPRLSASWIDAESKRHWTRGVAEVLIECDPRAITPPYYTSVFLEILDPDAPFAVEVLEKALNARVDGVLVNENNVELLQRIGEVHYARYARGSEASLEPALVWFRRAAVLPDCPTMIVEFVAELSRKRGHALVGWLLFRKRAETAGNPDHREHYLAEGEAMRRRVLMFWAGAAERRLGRWPASIRDLAEEIPEEVREAFRRNPQHFREFMEDGVEFVAETRDVVLTTPATRAEEKQREYISKCIEYYEQLHDGPPATIEDLKTLKDVFGLPQPPRHGTRWTLAGIGEPTLVPYPEDPRIAHRFGAE
jgi:hypothetical protein